MKIRVTMVDGPLSKVMGFDEVTDMLQVSGAGKDMLWQAFRKIGTTVKVPMENGINMLELVRVA